MIVARILAGVLLCTTVFASDWRDDFQRLLLTPSAGFPSPLTATRSAQQKRYVLISGLFSDLTGGSYQETRRVLTASGVPDASIHSLAVSSVQDVRANIEQLHQLIVARLAGDLSTPTVFVGHSLGAVSLWGAMLLHADFYQPLAANFVLLQGPFRGSPLATGARSAAEYLTKSTEGLTGWSWFVAQGARYLTSSAASAVTDKLTPDNVAEALKTLHRSHAKAALRLLGDRTLFVATSYSGLASALQPNAGWLQSACAAGIQLMGYGESDSVVPAESQFPEGLDVHLLRRITGFHHNSFTGTTEGGEALGRALALLQ